MRVLAKSPSHLSRAMFRVDKALEAYAPPGIEFVSRQADADFVVLPVVGYPDTLEAVQGCIPRRQSYALIQYCMRTTQKPNTLDWMPLWQTADCVWSYYDLPRLVSEDQGDIDGVPFYHAPLGVDEPFTFPYVSTRRTLGAVTSGYVSRFDAEAIEEVAIAARIVGSKVAHVGPFPEGFKNDESPGKHWSFHYAISDEELANLYRSSLWVSGLRHTEGFELPALEGLCCGARPILFDRPEMRQWFDGHAVFVPECHGEELVARLVEVMSQPPEPVTTEERERIMQRFSWRPIVEGFWANVLQSVGQ